MSSLPFFRQNPHQNLLSRRLFLATIIPLSLSLLGCPTPPKDTPKETDTVPNKASNNATKDASAKPTKKLRVGLVTDVGGVDDKSFNQAAWEGLKKAQAELGCEIKFIESKSNADYVPNLTQFGRGKYDLVFALGFKMQDALKEVAEEFPDVKFAIIDGDAPVRSHCVAYKFREEEGSYLVGALAGKMTKSNIIGFVGGEQMPLIEKFQYAFMAGVTKTNPAATVLPVYAGSFKDPNKGMELAKGLMAKRADIIYHASGSTGIGVIKAIQNQGKGYAIGVDLDQDALAPGRVLTSMVKRVDNAVFTVCEQLSHGEFKDGTVQLGLKEGGIALSEMKYTKKDIPADVLKEIEDLKQLIISEKIAPPKNAEELERIAKNATTP
jgi:basic membrane protein A and related proteins